MSGDSRDRRLRRALFTGLACGLTTFLVAILVLTLLPEWSHSQQGAVVGGWMVFCFGIAALAQRRLHRDPPVPMHRRPSG